jgi:hypothetical protein
VLQPRPNTFAQTILLPHFSLATKRRTIHTGWLTILELMAISPFHRTNVRCRLKSLLD